MLSSEITQSTKIHEHIQIYKYLNYNPKLHVVSSNKSIMKLIYLKFINNLKPNKKKTCEN